MQSNLAFSYQPQATVPEILDNLERFGQQNTVFDGNSLAPLFYYPNEEVRVQAVKTLGKLHSLEYLDWFVYILQNDKSTMVKREAVSSIGRMRTPQTIDTLIEILQHEDPKVVCQAIRGLLIFKGLQYAEAA